MKLTSLFIISMLLFLVACGKKATVKAVIFERKIVANNRLLIRFRYSVNNKFFIDSATVANKILPTDSIIVFINPASPSKSLPDLSGK